jgi:hypothetical protein
MIKLVIIASVVALSLTSLSVLAGEKLVEAKVGPTQTFQKDVWGGTPPLAHELSLGLAANDKAPGRNPASENEASVVDPLAPTADPLAPVVDAVMNDVSERSKTAHCIGQLSAQLNGCKLSPQIRSSETAMHKCADQKIAAYKACTKE